MDIRITGVSRKNTVIPKSEMRSGAVFNNQIVSKTMMTNSKTNNLTNQRNDHFISQNNHLKNDFISFIYKII